MQKGLSYPLLAAVLLTFGGCGGRTGLAIEEHAGGTDARVEMRPRECDPEPPPRCDPRPSAVEVCNGLDDDCDGGVDEELPLSVFDGPWTVVGEGELGGSCEGCDVPADPAIACIDYQLHVLFRVGFDRDVLGPNSFRRRLGASGLEGGAESLGDWTVAHLGTSDHAVPFAPLCLRIRDNGFARWLSLRGDGADPTVPVAGEEDRCAAAPAATRAGRAHLVGRRRGRSFVVDHVGEDGSALATRTLWETDESLQMDMASHEATSALILGRERFHETHLFVLERDGSPRGAPLRVPDPGVGWREPSVVRTEAGWLVTGASMDLHVAVIGDEGRVVRSPSPLGTGIVREHASLARGPHDVIVAVTDRLGRGGGFDTRILRLDERGETVEELFASALVEDAWRFPRLYAVGGRVYASFTTETRRGIEARVATIGCSP